MTEGQSNAIRAQTYALYALCAILEARGLLNGAEVARELRRFRSGDDDDLDATVEAMALQLEDNPFGPMGTLRLDVIDGGKQD